VIDQHIQAAIAANVFPGAVVCVSQNARVIHQAAYGSTMYELPGSLPVTPDTIYDIASLTKIITVTALLRIWEAQRFDLDTPVAHYIPEFRASRVTLRHVLSHTSGLDIRLSVAARAGKAALWQAIYQAPLRHPPGSIAAYTNINTLLVGEIVARLWGGSLSAALNDLILQPLVMNSTMFNPASEICARIAPTEIDQEWRGGVVHGVVHDESAFVLGGVAGHAGLFSTASDLQRFCEAWLLPGQFLEPETIALATRNHAPVGGIACGLGWMLARQNFMGTAAATCFGHTGFTGAAMILNAAQNLAVIVLTNRTFPQRTPPTHHAVIAAIVESAITSLPLRNQRATIS
jgi:serine-type D-Ala-D-Ala carboxypeptidase